MLSRTGIQPAHPPHHIPAREDADDDIPGLISDSESDSDDDSDSPRRVAPASRRRPLQQASLLCNGQTIDGLDRADLERYEALISTISKNK